MAKKVKLLLLWLLFLIYLAVVKYIRPFFYNDFLDLEGIIFVCGVVPNFLGAIMTYLLLDLVVESSVRNKVIFVFILVLFMEIQRTYMDGISFDTYDIIASIIGLITIVMIDKRIRFKKEG